MTVDGGGAPLDLCFIGCGDVTRRHSRTLAAFRREVRLHYASRDRARAADCSRRYGGADHFGSYEEALGSARIDAVLIATPPFTHLELTLAGLRAGKHVIVEKPAFLRSSDVAVVRDAAAAASRRVLVAENYRYKPLLHRLRQLIEADAVGDVLLLHVNALKRQDVSGWRDDARVAGGGALFEGGIHWVNFLANLGLTIESVQGLRPGAGDGLERTMVVALRYAEGPVGLLYYSWEVPSLFRGLRLSRIFGRAGSITFESNGLVILVNGARKRLLFPGLRDIAGYRGMFRDFLAALRSGAEPLMTLDQAERDLALIESVYRSLGEPETERTP